MSKKPSSSPDRGKFQLESYIRAQEEKGEPVDQNYLDLFGKLAWNTDQKFDDSNDRRDNLEYDLLTTDWILAKVRERDDYAQNLYAALCNNDFQRNDIMPILKSETWSCSWRSAGGIVSDMCGEGDYIDWYCSGIRGNPADDPNNSVIQNYVGEGVVTDEIREDLFRLGWVVVTDIE
jgi:hypothetical protein